MMLLVDIGNSRVKWAISETGTLGATGDFRWSDGADAAAGFAGLAAVPRRPDRVLVSNVAGPAVARAFAGACRSQWQLDPEFAVSQPHRGSLCNGYADYRQLGVDRWLALLAAWDRGAAPACVVDAGTALTVDLLDAGGRHLGGYIAPGAALMSAALDRSTGDIGRFRGAAPAAGAQAGAASPGRSTAEAVTAGAWLAAGGLIDRARALLESDSGPVRLLLTGGDAAALLPVLRAPVEHCPLLVLEGLQVYAAPVGDR